MIEEERIGRGERKVEKRNIGKGGGEQKMEKRRRKMGKEGEKSIV